MNAIWAMQQLRQGRIENKQLQHLFGAGVVASDETVYKLLHAPAIELVLGGLRKACAEAVEAFAQFMTQPMGYRGIEAAFFAASKSLDSRQTSHTAPSASFRGRVKRRSSGMANTAWYNR